VGGHTAPRAIAAEDLSAFLRGLQLNGSLALANDMPEDQMFRWRRDLSHIADWLKELKTWGPDPMQAALAIVLHVKEVTAKRRLASGAKTAILDVLTNARDAVHGLTPKLTSDSFEQALKRASRVDRAKAEKLLHSWKSLPLL
jgi:hypothetical protein